MSDSHPYRAAVLPLAIAALIAAPGARAQAGNCSDAFDGTGLGPAWTFIDADSAAGGSAAVQNGKLVLAGKGADVYGDKNQFVAVRRSDLAGDFDVSVKIDSQSNTHEWAQAGILAANDVSSLSKGGYAVVDVTPGQGFHLFYDASGTAGTLETHVDAGKSAYPVWVRLARVGRKFTAYYKTQAGAAWTALGSGVTPQKTDSATPSQIALFSLSHSASAEGKTVFDDFACAGGATALAAPRMGPSRPAAGPRWERSRGGALRRADGRALGSSGR